MWKFSTCQGKMLTTLKLLRLLGYLASIPVYDVVGGSGGSGIRSKLTANRQRYPPSCSSEIYCHGPLLHTVQMARLDSDSKTFVDQKILFSPEDVMKNFVKLNASTAGKPTREQVKLFVQENFGPSGVEMEDWEPDDWVERPKFIQGIKDITLTKYGVELNAVWKTLGRKIIKDVKVNEDSYSLIYVPNPVIVPGGRFTEFYYWDQYWILKGLLHCEMHRSVRGMIENFLHMVRRFGYVPNGGRIYYTRSQPPMLIPMVRDYVEATGNWTFVRNSLDVLDQEFQFWMINRTVGIIEEGQKYRFVRYSNELAGPRPESYWEDYELANRLKGKPERDTLYINLKSGAESGWDFSSRWFAPKNDLQMGNLLNIKTRAKIPVDLNALIYNNAKIMANFYRHFDDEESASEYEEIASEWHQNINKFMWNDTLGCWFDYDMEQRQQKTEFYVSNVVPLWVNISVENNVPATTARVLDYLRKSGALDFPGGVPASMHHSGEQWDFPNGWAPLQHIMVDALYKSRQPDAQAMAVDIAQRWIDNNYQAFRISNNTMFEKYDVQSIGAPGGGGEYEVVVGFGWSNGVIIDFLSRFGGVLRGLV